MQLFLQQYLFNFQSFWRFTCKLIPMIKDVLNTGSKRERKRKDVCFALIMCLQFGCNHLSLVDEIHCQPVSRELPKREASCHLTCFWVSLTLSWSSTLTLFVRIWMCTWTLCLCSFLWLCMFVFDYATKCSLFNHCENQCLSPHSLSVLFGCGQALKQTSTFIIDVAMVLLIIAPTLLHQTSSF